MGQAPHATVNELTVAADVYESKQQQKRTNLSEQRATLTVS
jgi:hypothetical protein